MMTYENHCYFFHFIETMEGPLVLVLTRKVGDVIAIGDNVKIIVMSIKGKQVRLGIEADKSTIVHREEIYQKIKQENVLAAQTSTFSTSQAHELLKNQDRNENERNGSNSKEESPSQKIFIRKKKVE